MKCSKCGAPLKKGAKFCNNCGQKKNRIPVQKEVVIVIIIGVLVVILVWGLLSSFIFGAPSTSSPEKQPEKIENTSE